MEKSAELLRLQHDLNASEEVEKKLQAEMEHIAKTSEAQSDGEVMVKAAEALGYHISLSELEQAHARSTSSSPLQ